MVRMKGHGFQKDGETYIFVSGKLSIGGGASNKLGDREVRWCNLL